MNGLNNYKEYEWNMYTQKALRSTAKSMYSKNKMIRV